MGKPPRRLVLPCRKYCRTDAGDGIIARDGAQRTRSQSAAATASSSRNATTGAVATRRPVFLPPDRPFSLEFGTTITLGQLVEGSLQQVVVVVDHQYDLGGTKRLLLDRFDRGENLIPTLLCVTTDHDADGWLLAQLALGLPWLLIRIAPDAEPATGVADGSVRPRDQLGRDHAGGQARRCGRAG